MNDKRLVASFKTFVDKVFLPTLKRTDPQALEWSKFSRMLSNENVNVEEVAAYVDSINNFGNSYQTSFEKKDLPFMRKRNAEDPGPSHNEGSFNPSKTFGGERARMMFMKEEDGSDKKEGFGGYGMSRDDSRRNAGGQPSQNLLPGL